MVFRGVLHGAFICVPLRAGVAVLLWLTTRPP
jgi:hypothetical protein